MRHFHGGRFRGRPPVFGRTGRRHRGGLRRRLFAWFGATIVLAGLAASAALLLVGPGRSWQRWVERAQGFVSAEFANVWDEPARRDEMARAAAESFEVALVLEDRGGAVLGSFGGQCRRSDFVAPVVRAGQEVGRVRICSVAWQRHRGGGWAFFLALAAGGAMLWAASGFVARRLTRPLDELVRVAGEIGAGRLSSRVGTHAPAGEFRVVAAAINDMADRIERQMADQRELLAAVSHEIRSPLARLRVLVELVRERAERGTAVGTDLDDMDSELVEIDSLVGELLASSRLDFSATAFRSLDVRDLASRALERAGLPPTLLGVETSNTRIEGDPTLLGRALSNLLDNARRHGGGATALRVADTDARVRFTVDDAGPGFSAEELPAVFESFVRGERGGGSSLGLGLSLVRRIAEAHGGRAFAENRADGGGRVGFEVLRQRPSAQG